MHINSILTSSHDDDMLRKVLMDSLMMLVVEIDENGIGRRYWW